MGSDVVAHRGGDIRHLSSSTAPHPGWPLEGSAPCHQQAPGLITSSPATLDAQLLAPRLPGRRGGTGACSPSAAPSPSGVTSLPRDPPREPDRGHRPTTAERATVRWWEPMCGVGFRLRGRRSLRVASEHRRHPRQAGGGRGGLGRGKGLLAGRRGRRGCSPSGTHTTRGVRSGWAPPQWASPGRTPEPATGTGWRTHCGGIAARGAAGTDGSAGHSHPADASDGPDGGRGRQRGRRWVLVDRRGRRGLLLRRRTVPRVPSRGVATCPLSGNRSPPWPRLPTAMATGWPVPMAAYRLRRCGLPGLAACGRVSLPPDAPITGSPPKPEPRPGPADFTSFSTSGVLRYIVTV